MDWLEEKAGELGKFLQEKSLVRALVCYLCIGMVGVAGVYWITKNICLGSGFLRQVMSMSDFLRKCDDCE